MLENLESNPAIKMMMLPRLKEMASDQERDRDGTCREIVAHYEAADGN
jgi:hypothetical protein